MGRVIDYEARKKDIFFAIVNRYIHDASAVSSEVIAHEFGYSSATIRNVMVELEDLGYIAHTHTSSGRVPTDRGYRYYVNNLLCEIGMLVEEKEKVAREYGSTAKELESLLKKTSDILSSLTHCTGIVSLRDQNDKIFYNGMSFVLEQPEFSDLKKIRWLVGILEEKQRLLDVINQDLEERIKIYIGDELPFADIADCTLIVSGYSVNHRPGGRIAVFGPTRMEYAKIIPVIEHVSDILSGILSGF